MYTISLQPAAEDLPIHTEDFTLGEVQDAIKQLNDHKALAMTPA